MARGSCWVVCGCVDMRLCGCADMRLCGYVDMRLCGCAGTTKKYYLRTKLNKASYAKKNNLRNSTDWYWCKRCV